jgi:FkbM family methyltransferase
MNESLALGLPNGKACHFTSAAMRTVAKYLRWETFQRGQYSRAGFELQVDDTVVDIGANIGMFALWAGPQITRGRLICIEPNPHALECLKMNVYRNNLHNVTIVAAAAGGENGTMELISHHGWEAMAHSASLEAPWLFNTSTMGRIARRLMQRSFRNVDSTRATNRFTVHMMPLSRILEEHNVATVNFLKIDCEGSEYEVLRNIDAENWARIQRVVVEYHDIGRDRNHAELEKILRTNGFEVEALHATRQTLPALIGIRVGMIWAKKPTPRRAASG